MRDPFGVARSSVLLLALLAGCVDPRANVASGRASGGSVDRLIGATPTALEAEFGRPLLLRRDGPAQVWLYRSSVCAMDLILYPDRSTGSPRVAIADARTVGGRLSDADCLVSLGGIRNRPTGRIAGTNF